MELLITAAVLLVVLLAIPAAGLVALARTTRLLRSIEEIELNMRALRLRLEALEGRSSPPVETERGAETVESGADTAAEERQAPPSDLPGTEPPGPPAEEPVPPARPRSEEWQGSGAAPEAGASEAVDIEAVDIEAVDIETVIGTKWTLRVGLGVLAIALALFARTVAPLLPPGAKVAVAYAAALALFAMGRFYEHRLERFARPVMAGGLAFGFFVAYAAHFVPAMSAVPITASAVWMGFSLATLVVAAERWKSEGTAMLAFLLGHVSAYVAAGRADAYSLVILTALASTAAVLLLRNEWIRLGVLAVSLSYVSHFLWILEGRSPVYGGAAFWISLVFLSTYYVIFLVADALWWGRAAERGSPTSSVFASPRHLGPINVVLYVSVASFAYVTTETQLANIEWFYLTLGTVQGLVAWFYGRVRHRDHLFYAGFASILWTMGLFAALDALSLNLVLTGQALLLLATAHRTRLWIFHGLSQATLAVAFIHYWVYPHPAVTTWALFLGGLGIAAVYLVTASLEEVWYDEDEAFAWGDSGEAGEGRVAAAFRDWFRPSAPLLAPLHAMLGAVVLLREVVKYFGPGIELAWFLAIAALAVGATVVLRRRVALLFVPTVLAASAVGLVAQIPTQEAALVLVAGLGTVTLALLGAVRLAWKEPLHPDVPDAVGTHVQAGAILALAAAAVASVALDWSFPAGAGWLLVPVLVLAIEELVVGRKPGHGGTPTGAPHASASGAPEAAGKTSAGAVGLPLVLSCAAAALAVRIVWVGVGVEPRAMIMMAGGAAGLAALAAPRRDRLLFAAGYTLMVGGYYSFLTARVDGTPLLHPVLEEPWLGAFVSLVPLAIGLALDRAGSDREWTPSEVDGTQVLTFGAYAIGLGLIGTMAHLQLGPGSGWPEAAGVAIAVGLVAASRPLRTALLGPSAVAGLIVLHLVVLGRAAGPQSFDPALAPMVLFGVLTLVVERLLGWARPGSRKTTLDRTATISLVTLAAVTVMVSAYHSTVVGPTWATAAWSVVGGVLMAAGFVLASALYRRVALAVLTASLIRVFIVDTRGLSDTAEIAAFLVLGLSLVGVAWLYARFQERLKRWF